MFLVTGGSGFLGKHLLEHLAKKEKVCALLREGSARVDKPNVIVRYGDLRDVGSLRSVLDGVGGVIHCAALIHSWNKSDFYDVNVKGTENLVKACEEKGVGRLIFISSINVKLRNPGLYGRSKQEAEEVVRNSELDWTIIRPTLIYGKGSRTFGKMVKTMERLPFFPLLGSGRFLIQPIFVDDVVLAIDKVRKNKKCVKKVYEIGGKEAITYGRMIDIVARSMGVSKPKIKIPLILGKLSLPFLKVFAKDLSFSIDGYLRQAEGLTADSHSAVSDFGFSSHSLAEELEKIF